jgi:hypothetical protein
MFLFAMIGVLFLNQLYCMLVCKCVERSVVNDPFAEYAAVEDPEDSE